MTDRIALVLLAAGGSSRMGRAKQLLRFRGQSLLRRAAETSLATPCRPIVAVLGAGAADARRELAGLAVDTSENSNWQAGMGSSIKLGVRRALEIDPDLEAVVITLCDQPLITAADLRQLLGAARTSPAAIAATAYPQSPGVPAVFPRATFPDLLAIDDASGAKALLLSKRHPVIAVSIPNALTDVDTPDDYARIAPPTARNSDLPE